MSANMKTKMIKVEGALAEAEKICAKYQVKDHIKLAALGAFSKNCILAVIEKKHNDLPFFGSVEAAGVEFVQNLNEQMGNPGIVSPWVVPLAPSQPEASSSGKQKITKNAHGEKTFEPFGKICIEPLRVVHFFDQGTKSIDQTVKNTFFRLGHAFEAENIGFDGQNQQCCHAEGCGLHRGNDGVSEER